MNLSPIPLLLVSLLSCSAAIAQKNDIGWIAPEGKIINYRTLTWNDFQNKEDKEHAKRMAAQGYQTQAYVIPRIYFKWVSGEQLDNGRVKVKLTAKCAFQSHAFVREDVKNAHSNYIFTHEHDHYDIALIHAQKMEEAIVSRDYSPTKYNDEINKTIYERYEKYEEMQRKYDNEVNPHGTDDVAMQSLWDMRIKKCLENNTLEYFDSPESVVQSVKTPGQYVKRIPGENMKRFATRCRPLYSEFTEENGLASIETEVWGKEKVVVAFYQQRYYIEETGKPTQRASRVLGYLFVPREKDTYKRILIDSFCYNDNAPQINAVFFANADSDNVKELVIQTSVLRKDDQASGKQYITNVYDNILFRALPGRLRRLDDISQQLDGGIEGSENGKPQKAKYKNEKDITEALIKMGYPNEANTQPVKRVIHR